MAGSGVLRLHASLALLLVFVNFCLTKIEKRKQRKLLPLAKAFPLPNEEFFYFRENFLREIRSENSYLRKVFAKNSHDFLISRKCLLAKISAHKVEAKKSFLTSANAMAIQCKIMQLSKILNRLVVKPKIIRSLSASKNDSVNLLNLSDHL